MPYYYTLKKIVRQSQLALLSRKLSLFACLVAGLGIYISRKGNDNQIQAIIILGSAFLICFISIICASASFITIWRTGASGLKSAYIGIFLSVLVLAYPVYFAALAFSLPMLNDITTDFNDPPIIQDKSSYNPEFMALQRKAYPEIQPIRLELNLEETYALVLEALRPMNLTIMNLKSQNLTIKPDKYFVEAKAYSLIIKLQDNIIIRLKQDGTQSRPETRIDMRSKSSFGRHDFGSNASRLKKIIENITDLSRQK